MGIPISQREARLYTAREARLYTAREARLYTAREARPYMAREARQHAAAAAAMLCLLPGINQPAHAGDSTAGKIKAIAACNVCHGKLGVAVMPSAPNLAGQNADYLIAQLRNFRNGKRQHEVMSVIAAQLKDGEIEDLASWFSTIPVEVKEPAK